MSEISENKNQFNPLTVMGVFWFSFGVIVLFATIFIKETPYVPMIASVITNLLAGSILFGAGLLCLWKAKKQ